MSVTGRKSIGVPIVMIHEGEGCHLTVELRSGHVYRGVCVEAEDNMNLQMKDVTVTHPHTGKESTLGQVYIQGKEIVFVKFPDILKHAPMFKRVDNAKHGKHVQGGMGFGRTRAIRTKVEAKARQSARQPAGGMQGMPPRGMPAPAPMMAGAGVPQGPPMAGAGRGTNNLPAWMTKRQ